MNQISLILCLSVILQVIAVIFALRLIPITGRALAWTLLSFGFLLMAARRTITLLHQEGLKNEWFHLLTAESVALLISIIMVAGVILIRGIFVKRLNDEAQLNKLSQAVEQSPISTIIFDSNGLIDYTNKKFADLKGIDTHSLIGQNIDIIKSNSVSDDFLKKMLRTIRRGGIWRGEIGLVGNDKNVHWHSAYVSPIKNANEAVTHYVAMLEDITIEKAQHKTLVKLAMYDALTGLPNRTLFRDRLQQAILLTQRNNQTLAVLMIDLDGFKDINDTLGHHIGDLLLKKIGPRLRHSLRRADTVSRMGGDEFLILLSNTDEEHSIYTAKKIINIISRPFMIKDHNLIINASIGITIYPQHASNVDTLIQRADVAMYHAKKVKCGFSIYNPQEDTHSPSRLSMLGELHQALEHDRFVLHYHPKIDMQTNSCIGVEVLVRWQHPTKGFMYPNKFIPTAEKTGSIKLLTQWVLRHALTQHKKWKTEGHTIDISINLSARDLQDPELPKTIRQLCSDIQVDPGCLILELTETTVMTDVMKAIGVLTQLSNIGIRLSIDDFGTGYSSLEYLKKLPVYELKIDKSFVKDMTSDDNDAVIVRSTIDLAHNLGLNVIAEGVDCEDIWNSLKSLQCDTAQGYFICKPLTAESVVPFLKNPFLSTSNTSQLTN